VVIIAQVDGRVRDRLRVAAGISREDLIARARGAPTVRAALQGRRVKTIVYVPGRVINFVTAAGRSRS
jgi:leucyl-tRNA synthetase